MTIILRNPRCYYLYGLIVQSDFDLSQVGLDFINVAQAREKPSIRITNMGPVRSTDSYIDGQTSVNESYGYYFRAGIGLFEFFSGAEIKVRYSNENQSIDFVRNLLNFPIACAFYQRGLFSLHASAVSFEGKVIIFPGKTMSGKSSIAAYFIKRGGKLITEDTAVIHINSGRPVIRSSYPFIKLSRDANKHLSFSLSNGVILPSDRNARLGFLLERNMYENRFAKIDYCIFLSFAKSFSLDQVKFFEASQKLINASLNIYPLTSEKHKNLFMWSAAFARSVKNFHFQRRKDFSAFEQLIDLF